MLCLHKNTSRVVRRFAKSPVAFTYDHELRRMTYAYASGLKMYFPALTTTRIGHGVGNTVDSSRAATRSIGGRADWEISRVSGVRVGTVRDGLLHDIGLFGR